MIVESATGSEHSTPVTKTLHLEARSSNIGTPIPTTEPGAFFAISDHAENSTDHDVDSSSCNETYPSVTCNFQSSVGHVPSTSDTEIALLRHFRYHLSPWLDVGNPESPFGTKVLLLAKASRPLLAVILAFAAHHRALVDSRYRTKDLEDSLIFRQIAEQSLESEEDLIQRVARVLFMLEDVSCVSPTQWRELLHQSCLDGSFTSFAAREELSEPILWQYFVTGTDTSSDYLAVQG